MIFVGKKRICRTNTSVMRVFAQEQSGTEVRMENRNPIQVADRLFGTVEYLAGNGPSSLMEIARALDLNKSTEHRILRSLTYLGYVKQDEETGKYLLTSKLEELLVLKTGNK